MTALSLSLSKKMHIVLIIIANRQAGRRVLTLTAKSSLLKNKRHPINVAEVYTSPTIQ